jgi:hypothetical protein
MRFQQDVIGCIQRSESRHNNFCHLVVIVEAKKDSNSTTSIWGDMDRCFDGCEQIIVTDAPSHFNTRRRNTAFDENVSCVTAVDKYGIGEWLLGRNEILEFSLCYRSMLKANGGCYRIDIV